MAEKQPKTFISIWIVILGIGYLTTLTRITSIETKIRRSNTEIHEELKQLHKEINGVESSLIFNHEREDNKRKEQIILLLKLLEKLEKERK